MKKTPASQMEETPRVQNKRPIINRNSSMPHMPAETLDEEVNYGYGEANPLEQAPARALKAEPVSSPRKIVERTPQQTLKAKDAPPGSLMLPDLPVLDSPRKAPPPESPRKAPKTPLRALTSAGGSTRRLLKRMSSVPKLLMASLGNSTRKLTGKKDKEDHTELGDTEHELDDLLSEKFKSEELKPEASAPEAVSPVSPRRATMAVTGSTENLASPRRTSLSATNHTITPFRRRSCLGNIPQSTPGKIQRRRSGAHSLMAADLPQAPLQRRRSGSHSLMAAEMSQAPLQRRRSGSHLLVPQLQQEPLDRPGLTRAHSNGTLMSVSQRNLIRRMSMNGLVIPDHDAPERVSDTNSAMAAMASTALPRSKRLSRRDLMRKSLSSGTLQVT